MNNQVIQLCPPKFKVDEKNPFDKDLFKRKELASQLTGYIDRLRDGAVIAIDAPWGEGKSWFGRNWAADLKSQGYRVVYLDAFQHDYVEDPFLLIASEFNDVITTDDKLGENLKQKAAKVMKAILPLGTKILLNVAGRLALGTVDASKEVQEAIESAGDNSADAAQKWLENKIESHNEEKRTLESFRETLQEFCETQDKPVVFFIDELDRCRPVFAVKLIERLKHFFDVPNLVFVLLLNKDQLEKAIEGNYGVGIDASAYLEKFIHLNLRLPKNIDTDSEQQNANWKYLNNLAGHYKFQQTQELGQFINSLSLLASITGMSLRELERGMTLLALNGVGNSATYLAWPIVLKLKYPKIYEGILIKDISAHKDAVELLQAMNASEYCNFWIKKYFLPYHIVQAYGKSKLTEEQANDFIKYKPNAIYHDDPMLFWLKRLDVVQD